MAEGKAITSGGLPKPVTPRQKAKKLLAVPPLQKGQVVRGHVITSLEAIAYCVRNVVPKLPSVLNCFGHGKF